MNVGHTFQCDPDHVRRFAYVETSKWTSREKAIARRSFDRALQQESDPVIQSTKAMAAKIRRAPELWELSAT